MLRPQCWGAVSHCGLSFGSMVDDIVCTPLCLFCVQFHVRFGTWCSFILMVVKSLCFLSQNVRGLGQVQCCQDVLAELISQRPHLYGLAGNETLLPGSGEKRILFATRLSSCIAKNSNGASSGILTAWDSNVCFIACATECSFSITITFSSLADCSVFTLTNVYVPTAYDDKPAFLTELEEAVQTISGPWDIIGDLSLTWDPRDKSNDAFNATKDIIFNNTIDTLALMEISLLVPRAISVTIPPWSGSTDV